MSFRTTILAISLASAFVGVAAAQTLHRWTDADGKVHYTDTPPPAFAKTSRTVNIDSAADQKAAETLKEQNEALTKRAAERNKTPAEREREKKEEERRARCAQLSAVVTAFDRNDPVFRTDEKGNKAELGKQDREFERLRSSNQFQLECNDIAKEAATAAAKARSANAAPAAEKPQAAAKGEGTTTK